MSSNRKDEDIKLDLPPKVVKSIEGFFGEKSKEPGFWTNILQSVLLHPDKAAHTDIYGYQGNIPYDNHLYHNGSRGSIYEESGDRSDFFDAPYTSQLKDMDQTKPFLLLQHGTGKTGNKKAEYDDPDIFFDDTMEGHPMSYDHFGSGIFYHDTDGNIRHYANYQMTHPLSSDRGSLLYKSAGVFDAMKKLGVRKIHTMPAQSDNSAAGRAGKLGQWSGGRIWPRMGFNSPLPQDYIDRMPDAIRLHPKFKGDTLSLMQIPGGEKHYEQNPLFLNESEFDLHPESEHSQYFNQKWGKYAKRAKRQEEASQTGTNEGSSGPSRNHRQGRAGVQQIRNRSRFSAILQAIADAGNGRTRKPIQFEQTKQEKLSYTSLSNALARVHSANEKYYVQELAQILARTGLKPHRVHSVLHDMPNATKPGVAASILSKHSPEQAEYAAAWHGMMAKQPSMLIFSSHPKGKDSIYRMRIPGKAEQSRTILDGLGVKSRILVPKSDHTEVVIHDPGRTMRDSVGKMALDMGINVEEVTGNGKIIGGRDRADGRKKYRQIIRSFENPTGQQIENPDRLRRKTKMERSNGDQDADTSTSNHKETIDKWLRDSGMADHPLSGEYHSNMAKALSLIPQPVVDEAMSSLTHQQGKLVFHPHLESLRKSAADYSGKKSSSLGFTVDFGPGTHLHINGGDDALGTYIHELWHAADNGHFYSSDPKWKSAYLAEILKGKHFISRQAMESPSEGFAELGRLIGVHGVEYTSKNFPKIHRFLVSKGLIKMDDKKTSKKQKMSRETKINIEDEIKQLTSKEQIDKAAKGRMPLLKEIFNGHTHEGNMRSDH